MKKIFIVLFLVLTISIPAFAKYKLEPEWMHFMTAKDGTEWYYDINSLKNRWGYVRSFYIDIKNTKGETSRIDNYIVSCSRKGWKPTDSDWKSPTPWILKKKAGQLEWYKEGYLSGYLINAICGVK